MPQKEPLKSGEGRMPQKDSSGKKLKQTLITNYYDEFTHIATIGFWEMFTPYKSSEQFWRNYQRKNWQ